VAELRDVTLGWSAKRHVLGQPVYNDKGERIGAIDDLIIAPDRAVSYAIIGAGGFLGDGEGAQTRLRTMAGNLRLRWRSTKQP
jgi:hypothetical protein